METKKRPLSDPASAEVPSKLEVGEPDAKKARVEDTGSEQTSPSQKKRTLKVIPPKDPTSISEATSPQGKVISSGPAKSPSKASSPKKYGF
jgi:hypothetical protein